MGEGRGVWGMEGRRRLGFDGRGREDVGGG